MTADQSRSEDPGTGQPRPQEQWQLTADTPENYERYLVPALFGPWAAQLVELAAPGPGERVLDVACGTGIVARRAAALVQPGGAVAGLDSNQGMLEVARAAAAEVRPAIDWRAGDAADLPFPDGAFEVVLCQQGLQFFPDRAAALRQMRRVLVPDGRLALAMWRPIQHAPGFTALAQALERHAGAEVAAVMHAPFAGPDEATLRRLLSDAGFAGVRLRIGIGAARFPRPRSSCGGRRPAHPWRARSGRWTPRRRRRWPATSTTRCRPTSTTTAWCSPSRPGSSALVASRSRSGRQAGWRAPSSSWPRRWMLAWTQGSGVLS